MSRRLFAVGWPSIIRRVVELLCLPATHVVVLTVRPPRREGREGDDMGSDPDRTHVEDNRDHALPPAEEVEDTGRVKEMGQGHPQVLVRA